jgi:hypothetical protein
MTSDIRPRISQGAARSLGGLAAVEPLPTFPVLIANAITTTPVPMRWMNMALA